MREISGLWSLSAHHGLLRSRAFKVFSLVVVAALVIPGSVQLGHLYTAKKLANVQSALRLIGQRQMNQTQLVDLVRSKKIHLYWAGPKASVKYILDASDVNQIVLTIIPLEFEKSIRNSHSQITTYIQKDAFLQVLSGGSKLEGKGFINADGNAVFYSPADPKDAYVGFRGKDIQLRIYDPISGESLKIATEAGRLRPIVAVGN